MICLTLRWDLNRGLSDERRAIRFPLCETTSGESGLGACLPSHKKTCTGPPGQAETQTSKNPLQSGQRHSARPRIQAGRISPLSPPSEVSDILNASRRLNSLAPLESLKKKMSEREREREERAQVGYYRAGPFLWEKELSRSTIGTSGPR